MKIAMIQNGAVVSVGEHRDLFPNTSFAGDRPTDDWLAESSCMPVADTKSFNARSEKLVTVDPYIEGSAVFTVAVQQQTQEELARGTEAAALMARLERNSRLANSDWVVVKAFEMNASIPTAWAAYRQALRDVPMQAGFPHEVTWPELPTV